MKYATIHSGQGHQSGIHPRQGFAGGLVSTLNKAAASSQHEKLSGQAQKWVSQTFFGTMLKQMRNSPFKSKLFEGGRGGEAFQSLYDQRLADHMARGAGHKLVNAITRKIEARKAYANAAKGKRPGAGSIATQGKGTAHVPAALRA
jgi:Rod binding domain-containing protein